jgi:hypothetical protein
MARGEPLAHVTALPVGLPGLGPLDAAGKLVADVEMDLRQLMGGGGIVRQRRRQPSQYLGAAAIGSDAVVGAAGGEECAAEDQQMRGEVGLPGAVVRRDGVAPLARIKCSLVGGQDLRGLVLG